MRPYRGVDTSAFVTADPKLRDALVEMNRALMEISQELSANRTGTTGTQGQQAVVTAGFDTDNAILTSDGTARTAQNTTVTISGGDITLPGSLNHDGTTIGFYGVTPTTRQDLTGAKSGGTALDNLVPLLETLGILTDSTT